ncbi:MAG: chemotactic response regulator, transmits chemoreceptor signals to flagelllar motor component [Verrucomicrobiota bacterium]
MHAHIETWSRQYQAARPLPAPHALCAEDDPMLRQMMRHMLRAAGLDVTTAADGLEAWDLLTTGTYDILVTDNQMPGLTGLQLAQRLRRTGWILPVVMVSGTLPSPAELAQVGISESSALPKPVIPDQLSLAVHGALRAAQNWLTPQMAGSLNP